ncbi:MAG: nitroreductase family protein [Phycisphaerales bacterium]
MPDPPRMIPLDPYVPATDGLSAAREFCAVMKRRRTVRSFSDRPVARELIETIIRVAGTAPSGANKQPWRFVAVQDPAIKREIRVAAEAEEREFYEHRASERWLRDLAALGVDEHKPFLEIAPWLIVVFKKVKDDDGGQVYYTDESVGLAVGLLLTAAHLAGLATLTHTPSPMKFLSSILRRPANERPFLLIPVGFPAEGCEVPDIQRKSLDDIMVIDRPEK